LVFHTIAVLEAGQDPGRRETWLTVGRLKQEMIGLGSGRHVDDLVGRLCSVGFIEQRPAERDRRVRILRGTDKLWAHHREWLAAHFAPLAHLFPAYDYGPILRCDPDAHARHLRTAMVLRPLAIKLMVANRDVMLFFERAGGYMVIAALLQAAMADGGDMHATVPYADVGDRFGISRTHVRQMLTGRGGGRSRQAARARRPPGRIVAAAVAEPRSLRRDHDVFERHELRACHRRPGQRRRRERSALGVSECTDLLPQERPHGAPGDPLGSPGHLRAFRREPERVVARCRRCSAL
jgi:hypothetical protein